MKVKEIMSKNVANIQDGETVERAAQLMKEYHCGSIPVCCQGRVEGIVTDRDIALRTVAEGKNASQQKVKDIMTASLATGTPEMDVCEAAKLMSEHQIRRLPIVNADDIVGILSLCDISVKPNGEADAGNTLKAISQPTGAQG